MQRTLYGKSLCLIGRALNCDKIEKCLSPPPFPPSPAVRRCAEFESTNLNLPPPLLFITLHPPYFPPYSKRSFSPDEIRTIIRNSDRRIACHPHTHTQHTHTHTDTPTHTPSSNIFCHRQFSILKKFCPDVERTADEKVSDSFFLHLSLPAQLDTEAV